MSATRPDAACGAFAPQLLAAAGAPHLPAAVGVPHLPASARAPRLPAAVGAPRLRSATGAYDRVATTGGRSSGATAGVSREATATAAADAPRRAAGTAASGALGSAAAPGAVVAVLGAESTGKTTLAHALALALRARGREAVAVGEYLREFCDAQGRTPRADEQAAIAAEQWRRIDAAARGGAIVVADTTPLTIAVYSDYLFGDRTLYEAALERQRACACTLLTGLDLPWRPDGLQRDGPQVRQPVDTLLRAALARAGLPHAVVYGEGEARTAAALAAVAGALGLDPAAEAPEPAAGRPLQLSGRCRECLVPDCEHLRAAVPGAS